MRWTSTVLFLGSCLVSSSHRTLNDLFFGIVNHAVLDPVTFASTVAVILPIPIPFTFSPPPPFFSFLDFVSYLFPHFLYLSFSSLPFLFHFFYLSIVHCSSSLHPFSVWCTANFVCSGSFGFSSCLLSCFLAVLYSIPPSLFLPFFHFFVCFYYIIATDVFVVIPLPPAPSLPFSFVHVYVYFFSSSSFVYPFLSLLLHPHLFFFVLAKHAIVYSFFCCSFF